MSWCWAPAWPGSRRRERLAVAGRRVVVLEARDRVGGRIHTLHDPEVPHPIELGPEFVHGHPESWSS